MTAPRVLCAPDSFKGTMSADVVAAHLAEGVEAGGGVADVLPLADGGEGTAAALSRALDATAVDVDVLDPLGRPITASFTLSGDGTVAVLDTSAASGLSTVAPAERDAEAASTYGTGQLLVAAARSGARRLLLGVGGSATTDGGRGALEAIVAAGGLGDAELWVLCDVSVPFEQAAPMFAPQKGADAAAVRRLTSRLDAFAQSLPKDPRSVARTGAAGGLSGALWACFDAQLVSGVEYVAGLLEFDERLRGAAAVITGEGSLDAQTRHGKVVSGVAAHGLRAGVPVWAVAGRAVLSDAEVASLGLAGVLVAGDPAALRDAARRITVNAGSPRPR